LVRNTVGDWGGWLIHSGISGRLAVNYILDGANESQPKINFYLFYFQSHNVFWKLDIAPSHAIVKIEKGRFTP
jgi:hypothetical protein